MEICTKTEPTWYSLSHHDRYRKLSIVTRKWSRRFYGKNTDCPNRTVYLDGTWIDDVPSFYLSLGEAINGLHGYFGCSLDALDDCLCGRFGVLPPLTIRLSRFNEVRQALDGRAWCRFQAEHFHKLRSADMEKLVGWGFLGDGSPADIALWTTKYEAAFAGKAFAYHEFGSYFDSLVGVLEGRGAKIVAASEAVR